MGTQEMQQHKKPSNFGCTRCLGTARPIDGKLVKEVMIGDAKLEVVPDFCYLEDMLSAGGGCELASITCCKCAWAKFNQLLPLLANRHLSLLTKGHVYSTCVRRAMLYAAETWPVTVSTLNRLRRNDLAMIFAGCATSKRIIKFSLTHFFQNMAFGMLR